MENIDITQDKRSTTPPTAPAAPAGAADTGAFDELVSAMAEQGIFGKLRIGASLLLFGEATIPTKEPHG